MTRYRLLALLLAVPGCETAPDSCSPCDFTANSCPAGEACVGDPELGTGTCSASDEAACEQALADDGKADGAALPHEAMTRGTGRVLRSMKLWTLAWHVDAALAADVERYHQWLLQSGYWKSSLAEYGVGAGTSMGVVEIPGPPPATFDDAAGTQAEQIIDGLLASGALPPPDARTAYSIIIPAATTTPPGTGGYHQALPQRQIPYEVMTRSYAPDGSVDFDELTYSYAHETAEVATDPYVDSWGAVRFFNEVGDMCNNLSRRTALVAPPSGGPARSYKISRLFSNQRAAAGLDPCVPVRAGAKYRGVTTPITTVVRLGPAGNGSATISLRAFSSNPNVRTVSWHAEFVNPDPHVTIAPSQGVATIGTPTTLTITARGAQPTTYGIGLDFITDVPAPNDHDWNAGEVSQWNAIVQLH